MNFDGRLLIIGCGSVAQCLIPLALKLISMPATRITILDFVDHRKHVKDALERGVSYIDARITKANYATELARYVGAGDMIIDLAWNISTLDMVEWCREHGVIYVNTSVELWDSYADVSRKEPRPQTVYGRHMELSAMLKRWGSNQGTTAIVDHGANPGLVSHFTKVALKGIAEKIIREQGDVSRRQVLEVALSNNDFGRLAQIAGVKTIHISERDTQTSNVPEEVDQFVNTWSAEAFCEEAVALTEIGWGTHEREVPEGMMFHDSGPGNLVYLSTMGMNSWARSWVPGGEMVGMINRHGEAYSISDRLTVWEGDRVLYRPSVYFVYLPCDAAIRSLVNLEMRLFKMQERKRIMNDDIVGGRDELGVLLMGHDFHCWWTGSLLDIEESRSLVPHQNATTLQVAISAVSAALWAIRNPRRGFCLPDDIDHDEILKTCYPYLGPFVNEAVDWIPQKINAKLMPINFSTVPEEDLWQFTTFKIDDQQKPPRRQPPVPPHPVTRI